MNVTHIDPPKAERARLVCPKLPPAFAALAVLSLTGCGSDPATVQAQAAASVQTAQAQAQAAQMQAYAAQSQKDQAKEGAKAQVKSVAMAFEMWAADSDDKLPPKDTDLKAALSPYCRPRDGATFDASIFDRLTYINAYGKLTDVPQPANYIIAYVKTDLGTYVIHADGSVLEWTGTGDPANA